MNFHAKLKLNFHHSSKTPIKNTVQGLNWGKQRVELIRVYFF